MRRLKFLFAVSKYRVDGDESLFKSRDAALKSVNVVGCAKAALTPGVVAEHFEQLHLQALDMDGVPGCLLALTRSACSEAVPTPVPAGPGLRVWTVWI